MATSTSGQLTRLCAAGALAYGSYAMVRSPVLPLYARQLGATPEVVGLVVAASTLTGVFLKFPAGAFSDVVGRRVVLVAGMILAHYAINSQRISDQRTMATPRNCLCAHDRNAVRLRQR